MPAFFSRPCRDYSVYCPPSQHFVLGYFQPSLSGLLGLLCASQHFVAGRLSAAPCGELVPSCGTKADDVYAAGTGVPANFPHLKHAGDNDSDGSRALMQSDIRVLIADDHPIFRHGLRQLIEKQPGLAVIAEADSGASALDLIRLHQPDVAVLDINLPQNDGFYVARALQREQSPVHIIFLTMYKDEMHLNEALYLGIAGYVIKESAASDIAACIRAVLAGQKYVSAELSAYLLNRSASVHSQQTQQGNLRELTVTERRVLALVADYKTNREIANELFVSVRTIENHRASICSKLKLQGTHALMKFALRHQAELT